MTQALIGHTGFVGGNLLAQQGFDARFNSSNIREIRGKNFARVVCAGAGAVKWWANQNPVDDRDRIDRLIDDLLHVDAAQFTLISTVDVYKTPQNVSELDDPVTAGLHAYGRNRLALEAFVARHFPAHCIVRLPALFGPGLKKNAIYDLLHDHQVDLIHPDACFQWYPLTRLSADLSIVEKNHIDTINFATEPVSMDMICAKFFLEHALSSKTAAASAYDFRTIHAGPFGGAGGYIMDAPGVLSALGRFIGQAKVPAH